MNDAHFVLAFQFASRLGDTIRMALDRSDRARQMECYLAAVPQRESAWIRTPSVVVSTPDDRSLIGGHDIAAQATRVVADANVARGSIKVVDAAGGRILRVHPLDEAAASRLIRDVARSADNAAAAQLANATLRKVVVPPPRPPRTALFDGAIGDTPALPGRTLAGSQVPPSPSDRAIVATHTAPLPNGYVLHNAGNEFRLAGGPKDAATVVANVRSAMVDHIVERIVTCHRARQRFALVAPGMTTNDLRGLMQTVRGRLAARKLEKAWNDVAAVTSKDVPTVTQKLGERFALDQASVEIKAMRALPSGGHEIDILVDLPSRVANAPLRMRIVARAKQLIEKLTERLRAILGGQKASGDELDLIRELRRELEGLGAEDIAVELQGMVIVNVESRTHDQPTRRAA